MAAEDRQLDPKEFRARLEEVGMARYHHLHPFHRRMNEGRLSRDEIRRWVANRFYYQRNLPLKDAAIISNCPIAEVRRLWLHRIVDHDGSRDGEGGIAAWLRLAEAVGLPRDELMGERHVVPGVRFAVDAYVTFARTRSWQVAVASSLTELFAPGLMRERLDAFERYYNWIPRWGMDYFRARLTQAPRDSGEALELTLTYCDTRSLQEAAVGALKFKCDLLWAILDALQFSCAGAESPPGPDVAAAK